MAIKLHGMALSTNTQRVIAVLNELGLEHEFVTVDLRAGVHKQPPFLSLNPFAQIPVLEDGDLVLFESRAINRYLASNYKGPSGLDLLGSGSRAESSAIEVWLEVESQQFNPPVSAIVMETLIKPFIGGATDAAAVEAAAEKLGKVLDVYEARLARNKYFAGGEFTLADLNHMAYTFYLSKTTEWDLVTSRPHVLAWWETVSSRPAWKKTEEGIVLF